VASWAELGVKPASALTAAVAGRGTDRFIAVEPSLRGLLPDGLPRGSTVAVTGKAAGRTSLLLGLLARPSQAGSWCAVVGLPRLSLAAGVWAGVDERRLALVPEPGPDAAAVTATLLDGFDLVATSLPDGLSPALYTQLAARARNEGSVLLALSPWPGANLSLSVEDGIWFGRGRLRCRRLTVSVAGRGAAGRPRLEQVWAPTDPDVQNTLDLAQPEAPEAPQPGRLRVVA
jgi:hypothetical protein